jgi:8-oxo-dGTP pyrophosphatase MutT (NUDIX family)
MANKTFPAGDKKTIQQFSAGSLVIVDGKDPKVLLLVQNNEFYKRKSNVAVIDIGPKGRINPGEDAVAAADREVKEETGLSVEIDTKFKGAKSYEFIDESSGNRIEKSVLYFLSIVSEEDIKKLKLSAEHKGYMLPTLDSAIEEMKFESDRKILEECREYLKERKAGRA